MADALLSAAAGRIVGLLEEQARYHVNLVKGAEEEVGRLVQELTTIRNVLDDAENRRFKDKNINTWLWKLRQTSYEMEDILDEWKYAILKLDKGKHAAPPKQKVCSFIPSSSSCLCFKKAAVRHEIAKKILNVKAQLDEILKEEKKYGFKISEPTPETPRVQTISLVDLGGVLGRGDEGDFLVKKLTGNGGSQEESGIQVVSIVGVGGLGKTTLAQLVYKHNRVEASFDLRIWICVSDPFDLAAIAKGILERMGKGISRDASQLDDLCERVRESILGKKFLLVLDDVWTEEYDKWEPLETLLKCGEAGSKILVTTRSRRVARMMGTRDNDIFQPGVLSDEDCWSVLCRVARLEQNRNEFEEIGRKIAQKCSGLPLAAKTLGSLLRFKSRLREWENVLNSEIWGMQEAEAELFPPLLMSYKELSTIQKQCFAYCAFFPKDTVIEVKTLIGQWMALGYLGSNSDDMELKGKACFDVLAMRSLFQDFEKDDLDETKSCKMHDIVHDFAQFLRRSGEVEAAEINKSAPCQACDPSQVSIVNEFCSLYCLDCSLEEISKEIENLSDLRDINLSKNKLKELPSEIGNLKQLRHLNLQENEFLEELPSEIGKLILLQTLKLPSCETRCRIPEELGQLTNLRKLTGFPMSKLRLLKNLNQLGGVVRLKIKLDGKDLKDVVEDAREARLSNKKHIQSLELRFEDNMDEEESSRMDVIDALAPHPNLRILFIHNYQGSKLPLWIVSPSNQLRKLRLAWCKQLTSLPSLGTLEYLEEIEISRSLGLEFVGRELLGITTNSTSNFVAFPKLKKLEFIDCENWKEWEDITAEEEESPAFQLMPSRTKLQIVDCPALTQLPHRLLRKASSLEILYLDWKSIF